MIFLFMKTQKKSLFSTTLPKTHLINFFLFLLSLIYKIYLKKKSADNSTKGDTYTTCLMLQHTMSLRKYIFLNQWRRSVDIDYQSWICNYMPLLI